MQWVHHREHIVLFSILKFLLFTIKRVLPFQSFDIVLSLSLSCVCARAHTLETKISIKGPMAICDTFCRLAVL